MLGNQAFCCSGPELELCLGEIDSDLSEANVVNSWRCRWYFGLPVFEFVRELHAVAIAAGATFLECGYCVQPAS
jgi:hypothetical protein